MLPPHLVKNYEPRHSHEVLKLMSGELAYLLFTALSYSYKIHIYSKICTPFLTSHFKQKCRGTFFICSRQLLLYSFLAHYEQKYFFYHHLSECQKMYAKFTSSYVIQHILIRLNKDVEIF